MVTKPPKCVRSQNYWLLVPTELIEEPKLSISLLIIVVILFLKTMTRATTTTSKRMYSVAPWPDRLFNSFLLKFVNFIDEFPLHAKTIG